MICDECETVAHCTKHGCIPKQPDYEGAIEVSVIFHEGQRMFAVPKQPAQQDGTFTNEGTKAQRKPLTDEEIEEVWQRVQASDFHDCVKPFARAIEAKLKEKNT
jgi:hypothetical protein